MLFKLKKELRNQADKQKAEILKKFFKTGPGQYAQGDVFLGISVPWSRKIAKKYYYLKEKDIIKLLNSKIHEERLTALFIMIAKFEKGNEEEKKKIFKLYLKNIKHINNWDLVDASAYKILGAYLSDKPKDILYKMAQTKDVWKKRIAVIATFNFIKENEFDHALKIIRILLSDKHHLINKANGWMLREIGKRNLKIEESFLIKHYKEMPRVTLGYAIEKFPEKKRKKYLDKNKKYG